MFVKMLISQCCFLCLYFYNHIVCFGRCSCIYTDICVSANHPQIPDLLNPCDLQFSKFELFETDEVLSWL